MPRNKPTRRAPRGLSAGEIRDYFGLAPRRWAALCAGAGVRDDLPTYPEAVQARILAPAGYRLTPAAWIYAAPGDGLPE